jgi:hypothetical protein
MSLGVEPTETVLRRERVLSLSTATAFAELLSTYTLPVLLFTAIAAG